MLGYGLKDKGNPGTEYGKEQDRAPHLRSLWQMGLFCDKSKYEMYHSCHPQLKYAKLIGVHLLMAYGFFRHYQIRRICNGTHYAQQVSFEMGCIYREIITQSQQCDAYKAHQHHQHELFIGLLFEQQPCKKRREHHCQRT